MLRKFVTYIILQELVFLSKIHWENIESHHDFLESKYIWIFSLMEKKKYPY